MNRLTQDVRPIGPHEGGNLDPIPPRVKAGARLRFGADRVNAGIDDRCLNLYSLEFIRAWEADLTSWRARSAIANMAPGRR